MKTCLNCKKETGNPKYCSRSCSAAIANKETPKRKTTRLCSQCSTTVRNYRSVLCETHYQSRIKSMKDSLVNTTLQEYHDRKSVKRLSPTIKNSALRGYARSWFKSMTKLPCAKCGYDKHVELCHIKPISSFSGSNTIGDVNSKSNIIQLCPNCHWELDKGIIVL